MTTTERQPTRTYKQVNVRLQPVTHRLLEALRAELELPRTSVIEIALVRFAATTLTKKELNDALAPTDPR